jgi:hypothetical protein
MTLTHSEALRFIETGKKGEDDYDTSCMPFFATKIERDGSLGYYTKEVNIILETISVGTDLKRLYQIIGNTKCEYYFNNWILMNLDSLKERYDNLITNKQTRVIDFGFSYGGMGHCVVVSYDPITKKIFYRHDGGSNGYEREHHYNFIKDYTPEKSKLFPFSHWMDAVKNKIECWKLPLVNQ